MYAGQLTSKFCIQEVVISTLFAHSYSNTHDRTYSSPILAAFVVEDIVVSFLLIQDDRTPSTGVINNFLGVIDINSIEVQVVMVRFAGVDSVECWCRPETEI